MASSKKTAARKAGPGRNAASKASAKKKAAVADAGRAAAKPTNARSATPPAKPSPPRATKAPAKAAGRRRAVAKPAASTRTAKALKPKPRPAAPPRRVGPAAARTGAGEVLQDVGGPSAVPGLSEEDQIRAAKYLPRELPKRVFEEERFLFPETYGLNRIRLLVRDPEWIFAYWDVNPEAMKDLGRKLGERALALSRLTLRVVDPVSGASSDILLPPGARWWYVRTDSARRTYRAELGVTLPSGEFRRLAESNTVVTPRVGPSAERARRRMSYPESRDLPLSAAEAAVAADQRSDVARQPWGPGAVAGAAEPGPGERKGGASDSFRPGASDAFRR